MFKILATQADIPETDIAHMHNNISAMVFRAQRFSVYAYLVSMSISALLLSVREHRHHSRFQVITFITVAVSQTLNNAERISAINSFCCAIVALGLVPNRVAVFI